MTFFVFICFFHKIMILKIFIFIGYASMICNLTKFIVLLIFVFFTQKLLLLNFLVCTFLFLVYAIYSLAIITVFIIVDLLMNRCSLVCYFYCYPSICDACVYIAQKQELLII